MWSNTIHTHRQREREREAQRVYLYSQNATVTKWTTTFEKGYKVTLYSYSLRATALYPIYINGPNLGTQIGWCEYDHYTLVFDSRVGCWLDPSLGAWMSTMGVVLYSHLHATNDSITHTQCTNSSTSPKTTKLQMAYFVIETPSSSHKRIIRRKQ